MTNSDDFAKYYAKWKEKTGNKTIDVKIDYSTFNKNAVIDVKSQPYTMPASVKSNVNSWYTVTDKDIIDSLGNDNIVIKPELLKKRRS
jgi:ribose 5-phosphate isomerase